MKTLVAANQKGGVGKTSTIVHLAFDMLEKGMRVVVIDLDTQANASFTLKDYQSELSASQLFNEPPAELDYDADDRPCIRLIAADTGLADIEKMTLSEAGARLRASMAWLAEKGFEVCLIDTAPSLGVPMAAALLAADYVLSPVELEVYSIQGIKKMLTTIANVRKANPTLQFLGMLPSKIDARNQRHNRHLQELANAYPQLMIPTGIGLRSSIADALASGVPVWKIRKTAARKAAQEVRALAEYVVQKMEMTL